MSWYDGETGVGVAATQDDIIRDEQERSDLVRAIADVETAIAVSTPGTRLVLENFLEGAKKRVAVLDKKIEETARQREEEARMQAAAIAQLAEKEAKLSAEEKKTYSGFLAKEFFTKKDFGKLENFYAHTWDRLSEGGKDEMSHRVWEGIRHGEYHFADLPKEMREKEEDRVYAKLKTASKKHDSLEQIPESDRNEFIRAYEAGKKDEAEKVLNRDCFRRNVALETSAGEKHQAATDGKAADDKTALAKNIPNQQAAAPANSSVMPDFDSADINLGGMTIADSHSSPSASTIPDASGSRVNARSTA